MGLVSALLLGALTMKSVFGPISLKKYPADVVKIANMNSVEEILAFHGYPSQNFTVKTPDGYHLTLNRIPNPGKHPILLMHDFLGSAANFVMMGPWTDLAYLLYDQGYDVWLGNSRGSRFSLSHEKFNPKLDKNFWNFSWHEIGIYDLPAMINFILQNTKNEKLSYIGYSEGAKEFFVMASLLPEYNKKIKIMHALAPSVYTSNAKSRFTDIANNFIKEQKPPYLNELNFPTDVLQKICLGKYNVKRICWTFIRNIFGKDSKYFNNTMAPVVIKHLVGGSSVRDLMHTYQNAMSGKFTPFDENFFKGYPQPQIPYPLNKVKAPVALYYCQNDYFVEVKNIKRLAKDLPNVVEDYLVPVREWSHLDPIIATNAREKLYHHILDIEKKNNNHHSIKSFFKNLFHW